MRRLKKPTAGAYCSYSGAPVPLPLFPFILPVSPKIGDLCGNAVHWSNGFREEQEVQRASRNFQAAHNNPFFSF